MTCIASAVQDPAVLSAVPADRVASIWPQAEPELRRACNRSDGRYAVEDVLASLLTRDMQLWLSVDVGDSDRIEAVCVTEIVRYPQERRCGLVFCAGHRPARWLHHLDEIGGWARAQGCAALELQGRPGWERLLRGWEKTHVLLRKRL